MATLFNIEQIVNKRLYAIKGVVIRRCACDCCFVDRIVCTGELIGTVTGYKQSENKIWWKIDNKGYVEHNPALLKIETNKEEKTQPAPMPSPTDGSSGSETLTPTTLNNTTTAKKTNKAWWLLLLAVPAVLSE